MALHIANQNAYIRQHQKKESHTGDHIHEKHSRPSNNNNAPTWIPSQKRTSLSSRSNQDHKLLLRRLTKAKLKHGYQHVTREELDEPHDCEALGCTRLTFNISGIIFQTQARTLNRFPKTLLGNFVTRQKLWDTERQCYCLNKHPESFAAILYYYQSGGRLSRPMNVPDDVFLAELSYYNLGIEAVNAFRLKEGYIPEDEHIFPEGRIRKKLWMAFEYPNTSWIAKVIAFISIGAIFTSIVNFCVETLPELEEIAQSCVLNNKTGKHTFDFTNPFFIVETICVIWFTIELVCRFVACPIKLRFIRELINIFDLLAIFPYFIAAIFGLVTPGCLTNRRSSSTAFSFLRVLRLLRVFRIFKLSKHSRGLQILVLTMQASANELVLFLFFLAVSVILFAGAIYYAELPYEDNYVTSIPAGFWWAIVTMTTVGYGDIVPVSFPGKIVGTMCVIAGVLTVALLVPIVVTNFNNFYLHENNRANRNEVNYAELKHERRLAYKWARESIAAGKTNGSEQ